ncbi:A24 family peptidase [Chromobacterium sp. IIBBL 290-4]|uniref:prepilin peptidase n=1 Tax=Chromobacterium sp. IIBBL 290-4 TaxID=2953890 RepID=UPI0020B8C726|nr:A24 family peptidase [Chromobacterium sp. IIBBL 290-4]UTH74125.1 prepilin peptidase [Chromobacterium sp. IIBBL 290-4]
MKHSLKNLACLSSLIAALLAAFSWLGLNASPAGKSAAALLLLGMALGSFLNVLVHRLPLMLAQRWRQECADYMGLPIPDAAGLSLRHPRSHCPSCLAPLRAWQLIPLLSYVLLRGECAACGARISLRYPLVETAFGLASAWIGWRHGLDGRALAEMTFLFLLAALALIDHDAQLLPDVLTQALLWLGLACNIPALFAPLRDAVLGAMAGYLAMWAIAAAFQACAGKSGLGRGDWKLMAGMGAWLGWQTIPLIIALGALSSAIYGGARIQLKRIDGSHPQAFGPHLIAACLIAHWKGKEILAWYLGLAMSF